MSSLVERLRVRSDRRPVYNLDDSDEDDLLPGKSGAAQETFEKIVRSDAVCFCFCFFLSWDSLFDMDINRWICCALSSYCLLLIP